MLDYYDCEPIKTPQLVEICKGHLDCLEDKCLLCPVAPVTNKYKECYRPILLPKRSGDRDSIRVIRDQKIQERYDREGYYR